jgi:DNA helicase II / ATP-dependent DNA helicase PcrA
MANYSAQQIFSVVSKFELTKEQTEAIEHAFGSALVVAGAGSGKTELMSIRAMYLVANEICRPQQILGLTFTRKAANELSIRILDGLFALRESSYWPKSLSDEFLPPKIATYNSFGNDVFRQLALEIGYESDATLITQAASVALVKDLLKNIDLEEFAALTEFQRTEPYLFSLVLEAAGSLSDNLVDAETAIARFQDFIGLASHLPQTPGGSMQRYAYTANYLEQAELNKLVFQIAGEYRRLKAERNLVDFSDQVALAYRAVSEHPLALDYDHVMLDEYQDTSSIQTMLLSKLFSEKSVMAVGDPNQSIYGWRGASSANLENFAEDFGSEQSFSLSKSWRSSRNIVAAANLVSEPLENPRLSPVRLVPGKDFEDSVTAEIFADEISEAKAVASWLSNNMSRETSAAILFRSKAAMAIFSSELAAQGLEYEVTGLSGLTEQPEVIDLIAALRVLIDPEAGIHLMRLLAGPRFRISARDIAKLHGYARTLSKFKKTGSGHPVSIIEALDEIRWSKNLGPAQFSDEAAKRFRAAGEIIHSMRQSVGLNLTELAWSVVSELEIDIELYSYSRSKNPLANLQAFISRISEYEQSAARPSLAGLISWLDYALEHESFELPSSGAKKGVVQLMSVHAAKGLEWDLVSVTGLVEGSFPVGPKDTMGWLSAGKLPFDLRRDRAQLPALNLEVDSQKELDTAIKDFKAANREHQLIEERRLAYVAFTRASKALYLTASYYKRDAVKPRPLAPFLTELLDSSLARLSGEIPEVPEVNPLLDLVEVASWPVDPLGENRGLVQWAASEVENAEPRSLEQSLELAALLQEQQDRSFAPRPSLPVRLSASKIVQLVTDPDSFYEQILRPMPQPFSAAAELGSVFHASLEQAFLSGSELDVSDWAQEQKALGQNFLDSPFAKLTAHSVELPIEYAIAGTVVVCKLDAVFETSDGFLIVDWKSGKKPADSDLEARAIQLALYRIGFARLLGIGVEKVSAAFYFAADNQQVMPKLTSEGELTQRLTELRKAPPHSPAG